jgi:hypothetical protein
VFVRRSAVPPDAPSATDRVATPDRSTRSTAVPRVGPSPTVGPPT